MSFIAVIFIIITPVFSVTWSYWCSIINNGSLVQFLLLVCVCVCVCVCVFKLWYLFSSRIIWWSERTAFIWNIAE